MDGFKRAPSTTCLVCASCRRRVTPCLLCASLLPFCASSSSSWLACKNCKLNNPLEEQVRRLLGFPPALALPNAMVRRVLVAHVGRSGCALAVHAQVQLVQKAHLKDCIEVSINTKEKIMNEDSNFVKYAGEKHEPNFQYAQLPFLQSEGLINGIQTITLELHGGSRSQFIQCVAVPNRCSCRTVASKTVSGPEKEIPISEGLLPKNQTEGSCHHCGGMCQVFCSEKLLVNEAVLVRCREQLVSIHCAEALSEDLNIPSYPFCARTQLAWHNVESNACHAHLASACVSRTARALPFDMLRLVNTLIAPDYKAWLSVQGIASSDNLGLDDILASVELFLQKRETLVQLRMSLLKSLAAQNQAEEDCNAILQGRLDHTAGAWLKHFFADRMRERDHKFRTTAQPFLALLDKINKVLQFFYAHICLLGFNQQTAMFCVGLSGTEHLKNNESGPKGGCTIEAARVAVASWLSIYHDVAHIVGVI